MSIERAIYERLRSWRPLIERVPAERISTGWAPPADGESLLPAAPYLVLERGALLSAQRHSGGRAVVAVSIRFHVFATSLAEAWDIVAELHQRCERQAFATNDIVIQDMKRVATRPAPRAAGGWSIQAEYLTRAEE